MPDEKYPRIAGVNYESMVDGEGVRAVIFLSGCSHHCPGCQNEAAQDPEYGAVCTDEMIKEIADEIKARPFLSGVTLSGGDPFYDAEKTYKFFFRLCSVLGEDEKFIAPDLWIYTGFYWEMLKEMMQENHFVTWLLHYASHVVDGRFDQALADKRIAFRGSKNQSILRHMYPEASLQYPMYKDVTDEYDQRMRT